MFDKKRTSELTVGIDASRNRSGGAKVHLIGILAEGNPLEYGIREVHVWAYKALLELIPDRQWLVKHSPPELEQSLVKQVWWQRFLFPKELKSAGCDIVLNTDAGTVSSFRPSVTMSRDMLSYEPGEIERYGISKARLRLILLRYLQNRSFRDCDGVVFLTRYAARVIQKSCGRLSRIAHIPHGVGSVFKHTALVNSWPDDGERPIRCLYVSNAELYKHQWIVIRAIELLRKRGRNVSLLLVGGGCGTPQKLVSQQVRDSDPQGEFVQQLKFLPQQELPGELAAADIFVFASSCENMPNTLVEAMAVGLPIACSDRGPMPEVLCDGGIYFDPEDGESIASAIESIIDRKDLRLTIAERAKVLASQYTWERCANETWKYVTETVRNLKL